MIPLLLPLVLVGLCYVFGGLMPGYWLVRWRTGDDVRAQGSGSTGATNVGRKLGSWGFITVFVLDLLKGAFGVWLVARLYDSTTWIPWACGLALIVGHVWPPFLAFRGGKGVATLLGVWLVLHPLAILICVPMFCVAWFFLRRFTRAGLCGLALLPAGSAWVSFPSMQPASWAALSLLVVLIAHREHLRRWLFQGSNPQ